MNDSAKTAIERYQNDARFRRMAQSTVSAVMQDFGPVNPNRADADAHDIALRAAVLLYQRIVDESGELTALTIERDHYKKMAEQLLLSAPLPAIAIELAPKE